MQHNYNFNKKYQTIVSPTEPQNNDRRKVWKQRTKNLWGGITYSILNTTVTFTQNIDGSIIIDGSASSSFGPMSISDMISNGYSIKLKAGTYTISGYTEKVDLQCYSASVTLLANSLNPTFTISTDTIVTIRPFVSSDNTYSNVTLNVQLEENSEATTYTPFVYDKEYILNENDIYEEFHLRGTVASNVEVNPSDTSNLNIWIETN